MIGHYTRSERVVAFFYDGTFPLHFLREGETISHGPRASVIFSIQRKDQLTPGHFEVEVGRWIVREPDGALRWVEHQAFVRDYQAEEEPAS